MTAYLFFDTETTGLPKKFSVPPEQDPDNWPRIVQIAWAGYDDAGREEFVRDCIIAPDGFEIPADAARIHGITTERARAEGGPIAPVLEAFVGDAGRCGQLVAHNADFDLPIITAECIRYDIEHPLAATPAFCTMKSREVIKHCKIPNKWRQGYKWPRLDELHTVCFGEGFDGAHDALADVRACSRCFFALREQGII